MPTPGAGYRRYLDSMAEFGYNPSQTDKDETKKAPMKGS